jgi:hypothetical protein
MKNSPIVSILFAGIFAGSSAFATDTFVVYQVQQNWDINNNVELDAGDHTLDGNTTSPGLFQSIYGPISGNTIDRASFKSAVSNAYLAGRGGVIDFEDANQTFAGSSIWIKPVQILPTN